MHLVIFSTSFQWNSIYLLFRISDGFTAVVFEVNSVWSRERRLQFCRYLRQLSKISTGHVLNHPGNNGCIFYRVPSFSQPDSLIPSLFNAYFTTNYRPAFEKYYWIFISSRTPVTRSGFISFFFTCSQTISMKNLNSKQNLRPEKGIYSYLVKFYRTIDTIYVEYTGLFCVSLLCPCVSSAATLWNESRAGIRPLII